MVRAPRLHRGGQRFESSIAHLSLGNKICAEVAQSVEHVTENHGVGGSNPPLGTTKPSKHEPSPYPSLLSPNGTLLTLTLRSDFSFLYLLGSLLEAES